MKYYLQTEPDNDGKAEDLLSKTEVQQRKFKFPGGYKVPCEYEWPCRDS